jgi:Alcohol dehydrogenase GroES-like domain
VSLLAADSRRIGNGAGQEKCPGSGRKRSIVMTQADSKIPRADREAFQVASGDTMKAIVYTHYGSPDVLQLKEVEKPAPKDDEVLIRIYAASANALDWHYMRGTPFLARLVNGLQKPKNTKLGVDVAGRVEAVGRNITLFQVGDDVFGCIPLHELGSFAEYVCAHEDSSSLTS